jgi:hypothetical protein
VSWTAGDSSNTLAGGSGAVAGIYTTTTYAGGGITVTVPADTFQRVLRIYAAVNAGSGGVFAVSGALSDGGASVGPINSGTSLSYVIEVTYTAAYDGQFLTISYVNVTSVLPQILAVTLAKV